MARSYRAGLTLLGLVAGLGLGGCVDMFTRAPSDAVAWRGTTSVGNAEFRECGAFLFELGQYRPAAFMWDTVSGRAWPTAEPATLSGRWAAALRQWWLEGYVTGAGFVQFESRRQQPVFFGARPYSVWRGAIAGDRMVLTESGSPCGREVVLVRG
jgi:hypothetical protein